MKTSFLLSKLYVKSKQSIVLNDKHVSKPLNNSLYRSNSLLLYLFGSSMTYFEATFDLCEMDQGALYMQMYRVKRELSVPGKALSQRGGLSGNHKETKTEWL